VNAGAMRSENAKKLGPGRVRQQLGHRHVDIDAMMQDPIDRRRNRQINAETTAEFGHRFGRRHSFGYRLALR